MMTPMALSMTSLLDLSHLEQTVYFQTKHPNLGKFLGILQSKMLQYFMAIWSTLLPFGIFCGH
jgi:hypothetical protein